MSRGKKKKVGQSGREYRNANGDLHRVDGPAMFGEFGEEKYYKNGLLHREDGPAVYWTDGEFSIEHYYKDGELHREDGPAVHSTGYHPVGKRIEIRYFLLGQELDYKEWAQWEKEKAQGSYFFLERIGKLHEDKVPSNPGAEASLLQRARSLFLSKA